MGWLLRHILSLPEDATRSGATWSLRLAGIPHSLWLLMGLVALFALLGWHTIRSYQREGRTRHRLKMILASIRVAMLGLLLLIVLKPTLVLTWHEEIGGEVIVLVDDSLSMSWSDRWSDPVQRQRLAKAAGIDPARLDAAVRPTRLDLVRGAMAGPSGVMPALAARHPLSCFRFGVTGDPRTSINLLHAGACGDAQSTDGWSKLSAAGYETDVGRAVRDALEQREGRPIAGVVVVSDGQNTSPAAASWLSAARDLTRDRQIPVYGVLVGDPVPPRNIAVTQLQAPSEVRKGSSIAFTAFVSQQQYAGTEVQVDLWRAPAAGGEWERAGDSVRVILEGDTSGGPRDAGRIQEVALRGEATDVGEFIYRASITPRPDEMKTRDNEATAPVRISDEKVSVLLVSGDGGWEFGYLRNYLIKHPEHYKVSVWQQNADRNFNQEASTGMKLPALPSAFDDLIKYDVVMLCDPRHEPGNLDENFIKMLKRFVENHHGGLLYIAGTRFSDANLQPGGALDALNELLPITPARPTGFAAQIRAQKTAYPVDLTPEGADSPLMRVASSPEENRKAWSGLPGVYRSMPVARLKTLATALLASGNSTHTMLDGTREPLIASQFFGKGRVLFHAFDSTWRWRYADDTRTYQRFWANTIDFLAAGRLEKKRILITTGGDVFDAGSEMRIRVEAYNRDFSRMGGKTFTVSQESADGAGPAVNRELAATREGFFEGSFVADRTGTFIIKAKGGESGQADWSAEDVSPRRIEVRLPEAELRRPEANPAALQELTGGGPRLLTLADAPRLIDLIQPVKQSIEREQPHGLWNTLLALIVLGVLLMTEWTLRKLYNMV